MGNYIPMTRAPRPLCFSVERATIAPLAAFLAKSIVERRNSIPILSNVHISAVDGMVTLRATDLDIDAAMTFPAAVDMEGDAFTVDAVAFADVVKAADKAAVIGVRYEPETGRVEIFHGRARNALPTLSTGDFPMISARDVPPAFPVDPAMLAGDLARLKPFQSREETRYYIGGVEFAADAAAGLTMTATTGTLLARITRPLPAGLDALPSSILPRKAADVLAKLAKGSTAPATLAIGAGRAVFTVGAAVIVSKLVDGTYPDCAATMARLNGSQRLAFYDLEPDLAPATVETFRKALGTAPDVDSGDGVFGFTAAAVPEFVGMVTFDQRERAGRYEFGYSGTAAAVDYLTDLAARRGFDLDAIHAAARNAAKVDTTPPASFHLETRRGVVKGATFGHITMHAAKPGDEIGRRDATPDEVDAYCADNGEGLREMIQREGIAVRADRNMPAQYVDGAFSIAMPREHAAAVCSAVQFIADDGVAYPLRTLNGINGALELSADAVRRLAGEVDPSTHVAIAPRQFYHGKALEAGWTLPKAPKLDPRQALCMTVDDRRAYLDACRPVYVGAPVVVAPIAAADHVADVPHMVEVAAPIVEAESAPLEPVEAPPAVTAPADGVEALTARLAALEAVVSRLARPTIAGKRQRSEAERRAVLRAWRIRSEARAAARAAALILASVEADRDEKGRRIAALEDRAAAADAFAEKWSGQAREAVRLSTAYQVASTDADRRAGRMVRAAVRHRTAAARLATDLRGAQAEARALARRLEDSGRAAVRSRVSAITIDHDSGAVAARAA